MRLCSKGAHISCSVNIHTGFKTLFVREEFLLCRYFPLAWLLPHCPLLSQWPGRSLATRLISCQRSVFHSCPPVLKQALFNVLLHSAAWVYETCKIIRGEGRNAGFRMRQKKVKKGLMNSKCHPWIFPPLSSALFSPSKPLNPVLMAS